MTYTPEHLRLWSHPSSYSGATWEGWYVFLGQNRDSDCLARSNFRCALKAIGGEGQHVGEETEPGDTATVLVVRESHWACGWIEWIAIRADNETALRVADDIARKLEGYPVVDEDDWSNLEAHETLDHWKRMPIRDRVEECQRAEVSVFAARRSVAAGCRI